MMAGERASRAQRRVKGGLAAYIAELQEAGVLRTVEGAMRVEEVACEVAHRLLQHGESVLFTGCGTSIPLVMNLYASPRHMLRALYATDYASVQMRIEQAMASVLHAPSAATTKGKRGAARWREWWGLWRARPQRKRGHIPCQEVVHQQVDLGILPIVKCWPYDAGAFVTLPMVITRDPNTGQYNVGMYRMQCIDEQTTALHWHRHKTGAHHYRAYAARGERMPVSVVLGGDPLLAYCATAPLPEGVNEWLLAGFLRGRGVRLTRGVTNDLLVPAEVDIVLEGYVDPQEPLYREGPFGDHTGYYSLPGDFPLFHITAITHRRNAVYPATMVGVPPMEDAYIAEATERIFLPMLRGTLAPEVKDWWLPPAGVAHNVAIVSVHEAYIGQAERVMSLLWGAGQMMFCKGLVLVSEEVDVRQVGQVLSAILRHATRESDYQLGYGPVDELDHASVAEGAGAKWCIQAVGQGVGEGQLAWHTVPDGAGRYLSVDGVPLLGVIPSEPYTGVGCGQSAWHEVRGVWEAACGVLPRFMVWVDDSSPWRDDTLLAWSVLASIDAWRDVERWHDAPTQAVCYLIDGRMKPRHVTGGRPWPNPVVSSQETIAYVDTQWAAWGLGECVESPSGELLSYGIGEGAEATVSDVG